MIRSLAVLSIASYAVAQSLSSACTSALAQAAANPDVSSCLGLGSLIPLATADQNTSVIKPIDDWLNSVCSSPACSNETIAAFVQNVTAGCSAELTSLGVSSDDVSGVIPTIQSAYPTVRKVVCLQDGNTKCITQTLQNFQDVVGQPLSVSAVPSIGSGLTSPDIPSNITCTNCIKEAYNVINQDFPGLVSDAKDGLDSQCGSSFTDGQTPSGISQSASNAAATDNEDNGALNSGGLGVSALFAIASLFAML